MAQPMGVRPVADHPASVISSNYCAPHPIDLAIVRKVKPLTGESFEITNIEGNIVFKLKAPYSFSHSLRVLLDAAGNPIVTFRQKINSWHGRWKVFRGSSTDSSNLLFSAKRSSMFQYVNSTIDVFLANNTREDYCDFKLKGSYRLRSCVIYAGDSTTLIAQMHKEQSRQRIFQLPKDKFTVTVNPNIDYAFIVVLILILYEIDSSD
ncbi:protein LURP-one-related 10-like [Corylus avellana]|uniref:protein LURP-one-related 10-like n=1 Tax=Corylus avellana TaxID=13451 RepID=UPI001E1EB988|nr:protein LURP-one-related 10-like [Corylus avellana]